MNFIGDLGLGQTCRFAALSIRRIVLLSIAVASVFGGELREWKSTDGRYVFRGILLHIDKDFVSIRSEQGQLFKFPIKLLHTDDVAWIQQQELAEKQSIKEQAESASQLVRPPKSRPIFDQLRFGDTRAEVEKKLLNSKLVKLSIDPVFLGRMGLNEVFFTRANTAGLKCSLSFKWSDDGFLKEIFICTELLDKFEYDTKLKAAWETFVAQFTRLYGDPDHAGNYPEEETLEAGTMLSTHRWIIGEKECAFLGPSYIEGKYQIAVRYTEIE